MKQKGLLLNQSTTIDSMVYTYFDHSNRLKKVYDGITDATPLGDFKDSSLVTDYTYDVNGNVTKDYNRKMHTTSDGAGAVYNILDRPDSIVIANKATLYYYYDISGVKLRKKVNDYSSGILQEKNYLYVNGFVYLNDTLQYALHETGRIRNARKRNFETGASYYAYEYDYFIRDHLNNVRSVLTEGIDTIAYQASMEVSDSTLEQALFANIYDPTRTVVDKPAGFDSDSQNARVSKLNASSGSKIGPSMVLKVMAGDKVAINTYAYYNTAVQNPGPGVSILSDLLSVLSPGLISNGSGKLGNSVSNVDNAVSPAVEDFLDERDYTSAAPKAYLNWLLFDNQFNYIASNSGVEQVSSDTGKHALIAPLQTISKNGYLYIYVSNESPQNIYFDDLTVKHTSGPLIQEQAYYPFGVEMAGISDKAFNKLQTNYKFNGGVESEDEFGVNIYSTFYRMYDPQLGRFNGVDIKSEESAIHSNYQFAINNPIILIDPLGDKSKASNFSSEWSTILSNLFSSNHGGSWSPTSGYGFYESEDEALGGFINSFGGNYGGLSEHTIEALVRASIVRGQNARREGHTNYLDHYNKALDVIIQAYPSAFAANIRGSIDMRWSEENYFGSWTLTNSIKERFAVLQLPISVFDHFANNTVDHNLNLRWSFSGLVHSIYVQYVNINHLFSNDGHSLRAENMRDERAFDGFSRSLRNEVGLPPLNRDFIDYSFNILAGIYNGFNISTQRNLRSEMQYLFKLSVFLYMNSIY